MLRQYFTLGDDKWNIYVYYNVDRENYREIAEMLFDFDCPERDIVKSLAVVTRQYNTGMTFTNTERKTSIVCIGKSSSSEQFANTFVHEAKHVQSHICEEYGIEENGEEAAYLIGYIVQRMFRGIRRYGRF